MISNYRAGVDAGFALLLPFGSYWSGTTQHGCSAAELAVVDPRGRFVRWLANKQTVED